jgi:hypothetical protein
MTKHLPGAPPANCSTKGPGNRHYLASAPMPAMHSNALNASEQGDSANIKQNTTNKCFFLGRRMK